MTALQLYIVPSAIAESSNTRAMPPSAVLPDFTAQGLRECMVSEASILAIVLSAKFGGARPPQPIFLEGNCPPFPPCSAVPVGIIHVYTYLALWPDCKFQLRSAVWTDRLHQHMDQCSQQNQDSCTSPDSGKSSLSLYTCREREISLISLTHVCTSRS